MRFLITLILITLAAAVRAEPLTYVMDPEASRVTFTFTMEGQRTKGRMPVEAADIVIDFERARNSTVSARIAADQATTPFFFATTAMKSPEVLDTGNHPEITFESTTVSAEDGAAILEGLLTIRGVTRPVTLEARVFRPRGTEQGDRREVRVLMTGSVDRNDFGASGYPTIVGPEIGIEIVARLSQVEG